MGLREYRKKRSFKDTPEPASDPARRRTRQRIFVVQLHHASHRHYDFRLELDGVLKSWAVPKGPSLDPAVKRLAVEVEDHPLSYATFEGDIPKGNYGAGHVDVFDHGVWEPEGNARDSLAKGELKFTLHGDVLRGSWVLVRTRKQGSKQQWLLIKHQDAFADSSEADDYVKSDSGPAARAPARDNAPRPAVGPKAATRRSGGPKESRGVPEVLRSESFAPELCRAQAAPPDGDQWLHESKWDGYRLVTTIVDKRVRLWSRNGIEWTEKLPELVDSLSALKLSDAQLDGEMIALRDERDSFNALQARLSGEGRESLIYMLFDMPHLDGRSLRDVPLIERKTLLADRLKHREGDSFLRYSEHHIGDGKQVFAQAVAGGLEGIVSKRVDSAYRGERNGDWVKVKARASDEFVVVGYTEPKGSRSGLGALLLAKPVDGALRYVGRVGTGLSEQQLRSLRKRLEVLTVPESPADTTLLARKDRALAIWVKPELVVEAFHQGIGSQGLLRQPAFKALREDKNMADLTQPGPSKSAQTKRARGESKRASGVADDVTITHPERIVFAELGISKGEVADYYRSVAQWLLPEIVDRPLSVVRCPDGASAQCFFQKHTGKGWGRHVHAIDVHDKTSREDYFFISDARGLLELVQMNVLEFHPWGARNRHLDDADRIVFDLDPHASVQWPRVRAAASTLRGHLKSIGLRSYLRTSGGKGLHVVVPLNPVAPWERAKEFAHAVASVLAELHPDDFVDVAGEENRAGKVFIDWLRNGRGATSVASYSLRARASAGVAMPLDWSALPRLKSGDAFTLANASAHLKRRARDPWADIGSIRQALPVLR